MSRRLAESTSRFLAKRSPRRGFLAKTAVVGSALAVAPKDFITKPGTAYAQVCSCSGSRCNCSQLCCDGYTEFCCTIYGTNGCPPGSLYGGWWRVSGSNFCGGSNRYYLDCHNPCDGCACGASGICSGSCNGTACGCALGSCGNRKAGCTHFRYGQCNRDIECLGPIVCRVVTCSAPWQLDGSCSTSSRTDEATRNHDRACLTTASSAPIGELDLVDGQPGTLRVRGWAIDPDRDGPVDVNIFVNGTLFASVQANELRPDIGAAYRSFGDEHGFDVTFATTIGTKEVCAEAVNAGGGANVQLGCQTVSVSATQPTGILESASAARGAVGVSGWALIPGQDDVLKVDVFVDQELVDTVKANKRRNDLSESIQGVGKKHGFEAVVAADAGSRTVCVSVTDPETDEVIELGCITADVIDPNEPFGSIDRIRGRTGKIRVTGWALDPTGADAIVAVVVNGDEVGQISASDPRPDVATLHPAAETTGGFDSRLAVSAGDHRVCLYIVRSDGHIRAVAGLHQSDGRVVTALVVVLAVVVAILAVLIAGLLRSHADILRALHSLGVTEVDLNDEPSASPAAAGFETQPGVPQPRTADGERGQAHDIVGATPAGGTARAAVTATRHTTLLAFLSSGCLTCRDFWDAFAGDLDLPGTDTRLVIVTQGPESESASAVASLAPHDVTVLMSSEAWTDYGIPVSPYFILVDGPSGSVVGEGAASTWKSVSGMLESALADTGRNRLGQTTPKSRARGAVREADTDEALAAAGIEPGDPRLFHDGEQGGSDS